MSAVMGLIFWASTLCLVGLLAYLLIGLLRQHLTEAPPGARRLQGRVVPAEPDSPSPLGPFTRAFTLRTADGPLLVICRDLPLDERLLRPGRAITVLGTPCLCPRPESLYRETGGAPALEALQVLPGALPARRWLALPLTLSATGVLVGLLTAFFPQDAITRSAATFRCPRGSRTVSRFIFPASWIHECRTFLGVRQGPWARYREGQLVAEGHNTGGQPAGRWTEYFYAGGIREQGTYLAGKRQGLWLGFHRDRQMRFEHRYQEGRPHGFWSEWSAAGELLLRGEYWQGKKLGAWLYQPPTDEPLRNNEKACSSCRDADCLVYTCPETLHRWVDQQECPKLSSSCEPYCPGITYSPPKRIVSHYWFDRLDGPTTLEMAHGCAWRLSYREGRCTASILRCPQPPQKGSLSDSASLSGGRPAGSSSRSRRSAPASPTG